jgi:hypothetical protein
VTLIILTLNKCSQLFIYQHLRNILISLTKVMFVREHVTGIIARLRSCLASFHICCSVNSNMWVASHWTDLSSSPYCLWSYSGRPVHGESLKRLSYPGLILVIKHGRPSQKHLSCLSYLDCKPSRSGCSPSLYLISELLGLTLLTNYLIIAHRTSAHWPATVLIDLPRPC